MNIKCQIFTPKLFVEKMLNSINYNGKQILGKYVLENSCGDGNFLVEIVKRYIEAAQTHNYSNHEAKEDLEKYILGFEIDPNSIDVCIENLNSEASKYGIEGVRWNIKNKDYLKYKIEEKADFIVGNPPYIMYQDLSVKERQFLKTNFYSCIKGKFDYCYGFIEKSINDLSDTGRMSYIVPSSIFKNVFGAELRNIMKHSIEELYDYRESVVFDKALISPAIICFNNKKRSTTIKYHDVDNQKIYLIDKHQLGDKWIFQSNKKNIGATSTKKFGDYFKVSNSIATLMNSVYVINKRDISDENENCIEFKGFWIEKEVLRSAASPRSSAIKREEYIIFPYNYKEGKLVKFDEKEFKLKFPGAYEYLLSFAEKLNERTSDKSAKWYEYGRSQALSHLNQEKMLLSSIVTHEIKSYRLDKNTIPYSGFYIISISDKSLDEAEKILKSNKFSFYLSMHGINANGKSLRFSVHDILNYPL